MLGTIYAEVQLTLRYPECNNIKFNTSTMARKRISVINETSTGRNKKFRDNYNQKTMTRIQFVNEIKSGNYENYHIRKINSVDTPVSNPDRLKNNNLD